MSRERESVQDQIKIEPFTLIYDILSNWWVILLGALAAAMLSYVVMSARYVPQYTTQATFVVSSKSNANAYNNLSSANKMAETFQKVLESSLMRKKLKGMMDVDEISGKIRAEVIPETNLLILTVIEDSPKEAIDLIRTIMDNYREVSYYSVGDNSMDVLEEPKVPMQPTNPFDGRNYMKKGFLGGAAFLIALIGMLSYMKDTIKREDEIEEKLDAVRLGSIAFENKNKTIKEMMKPTKKALLVDHPLSGFAFVESYKKLATKVDYQMSKDNRQALVVTSVSENEGKSTVAANLAISLAQLGKKVLLIDGDLRRPSQFLIFGKEPTEENELGEFLKGRGKVKDILLESNIPKLYLMVGRNCYSSSTEIVQSERMEKLMEACKETMDYIIIDTPPAGMMGDAEAIAESADAVLLVVKQNFILAEDINDVLDAFREHHTKVLGAVLNGVRTFESTKVGSYYGAYGKYGAYGNYKKSRRND